MATTLRIGARGDEVRWLQQMLSAAGYMLRVDGVFGSQTQTALASWQDRNMYAWTFERGALDDATRAALKEKIGDGGRLNFPSFRWDTTLLGGSAGQQPLANTQAPPGGGGFGINTSTLIVAGLLIALIAYARRDD